MKKVILLILSLAAFGAEVPSAAEKPLTEIQAKTLENLSLRLQLLQAQAKDLAAEQGREIESICKAAGIDEIKECRIDAQRGVVFRAAPGAKQ